MPRPYIAEQWRYRVGYGGTRVERKLEIGRPMAAKNGLRGTPYEANSTGGTVSSANQAANQSVG